MTIQSGNITLLVASELVEYTYGQYLICCWPLIGLPLLPPRPSTASAGESFSFQLTLADDAEVGEDSFAQEMLTMRSRWVAVLSSFALLYLDL